MTDCTPKWNEWRNQAKGYTVDQLTFAIRDARQAQVAMSGWNPEREGYYSDMAATYSDELRNRLTKTRRGR